VIADLERMILVLLCKFEKILRVGKNYLPYVCQTEEHLKGWDVVYKV
jgi:hypothetical protein